jgi:L-iditol 2-dehydrogenase
LLERRKIKIDAMATHHFPLEDTQQAFELVASYRDGVMKVMIVIA